MSILAITVQAQALGSLSLQQGQLDVIGQKVQLLGTAHLGGLALDELTVYISRLALV